MGDIIRFKKGLKDNLPILGIGEPGFTTNVDDQRLYIGGPNGNVVIPNMEDIDIINSQMHEKTNKTDLYVNALDIGCKTDGTDNSDILNEYFKKGNTQGIFFPNGNYCVSKTIETLGNVIMDSNAYLVALNEMDCVCSINSNLVGSMYPIKGFVQGHPKNQKFVINVDCKLLGKIGIQTQSMHWATLDLTVKNPVNTGVYTTMKNDLGCAENVYKIKVLYSDHTEKVNNSLGLLIESNDDIFEDIIIINCRFGVYLKASDCPINNIHHWLVNDYNWAGSWTLKVSAFKNRIGTLTVDTVETGIVWDNPTSGCMNIYISYYFAMVNNNLIPTEMSTSFKVWEFACDSDVVKQIFLQSSLIINNYIGQSKDTSGLINCGNNGLCPPNTVFNYVSDYLEPIWQYDIRYAPQGTFRLHPTKYKNLNLPSSLINNDGISLTTTNLTSGKLQRINILDGANYTGNTQYTDATNPSSVKSGTYNYYFECIQSKWNTDSMKWSKYTSTAIESAYTG